MVLADSELKLGNDGFADLELKLGIDLFAGKSEIAEGRSDFREIGDSMFGCQRTAGNDAAGAAVRRKAERRGKAGRRRKAGCCGAVGAAQSSMLRKAGCRGGAGCCGVAVWRWSVRVPFLSAFSRQLRGFWGSTADSKADGGDGGGDFRGESFERPVFAGVRRLEIGARTLMADGAERAHLANLGEMAAGAQDTERSDGRHGLQNCEVGAGRAARSGSEA